MSSGSTLFAILIDVLTILNNGSDQIQRRKRPETRGEMVNFTIRTR